MDHNSIYYVPVNKITTNMVNIANQKWNYNIQLENMEQKRWVKYLRWN